MYYYENKYPKDNDFVMVQIKSITDTGVYVSLLEYDGIEGMIAINELTNRRFRSYHKIVRIGRIEVAQVISVDQNKGYIDLSKKTVSTDDIIKCQDQWNKTKCVYTIMYDLSLTHTPLLDISCLYESIAWPLQRKYGNTYDAFLMYMSDSSSVQEIESIGDSFSSPKENTISLKDIIKKRLQCKVSKIRAIIDVTCFKYEGIEAIKKALNCAYEVSEDISVSLIVPSFSLTLNTVDKEKGIDIVNKACGAISKKIKEFGGDMVVREYPKDISNCDSSFSEKEEEETYDDEEYDSKEE